jgi:hypothetical protein
MNEDDTFDVLKNPPTEDEIEFGRKVWIYCGQHMAPHMTGWCTVSNRNKILLNAKTLDEAVAECRENGYTLYSDVK